jgi:methionyl-tRNA formyltransferase
VKILFAGTPTFAAHILQSLIDSPFQPLAVLTQPDRPAGRGRQAHFSEVKTLALQHQLAVHQPERIDQHTLDVVTAYQPDLIIVVAYGLLLPSNFLSVPRFGCLNLHASLLPRWRGAAPIQRAIEAGDTETGITLMQMDKGLDTGPMLAKRSLIISADDTSQSLHDKLATIASELLLANLPMWPNTPPTPQSQPSDGAVYAHKLKSEEAAIDWSLAAETIERKIRAFYPWPGSYALLADGTRLKIGAATIDVDHPTAATTGKIIAASSEGLVVSTGNGNLCITQAQLPGGRMLPMRDLLNGHSKSLANGQGFFTGQAC